MLLSPDCKQRYEAEGINHVVRSRRWLWEKRGQRVLGALGNAPTPGVFLTVGWGAQDRSAPRS